MGIFCFTAASRRALGPTQPPIQSVQGALSLAVKRPVLEANNSPPSSADVKNVWSYISTFPIRLHAVVLGKKKHRDNFTFYLVPFTSTFTTLILSSYTSEGSQVVCSFRFSN
jgi:hypothetical protein